LAGWCFLGDGFKQRNFLLVFFLLAMILHFTYRHKNKKIHSILAGFQV
jgi:hypothetical protein